MSKKISFGGISTALSVVCLLLTNVFVTNRIFFTCFATIFIPISIIKHDIYLGIATWISSVAVAFLIIPDKMIWGAYFILGGYTLLKALIEKVGSLTVQWTLKAVFYAILFVASISFLKLGDNELKWAILGASAVLFIVYDLSLSLGITYIKKKLKLF